MLAVSLGFLVRLLPHALAHTVAECVVGGFSCSKACQVAAWKSHKPKCHIPGSAEALAEVPAGSETFASWIKRTQLLLSIHLFANLMMLEGSPEPSVAQTRVYIFYMVPWADLHPDKPRTQKAGQFLMGAGIPCEPHTLGPHRDVENIVRIVDWKSSLEIIAEQEKGLRARDKAGRNRVRFELVKSAELTSDAQYARVIFIAKQGPGQKTIVAPFAMVLEQSVRSRAAI